jgi:Tfp pilus assembly protein PilX
MKDFSLTNRNKQSGAILVIALLFLVTITLLTVASMRSSNIGLQMVQNEESHVLAVQGAQALADAIVADPGTTLVTGDAGYTFCTASETGCNRADLAVENSTLTAAITSNIISARVERIGPAFRPPPRVIESSIDKFSSASFEVTTTYDRVDESLGRQQITEGVLVLVPAF